MLSLMSQVVPGKSVRVSSRGVGVCRRVLATAAVTLLAACGGGGGGTDGGSTTPASVVGPPTTAAALANTTSEAQQSASAAVAGADSALQRVSAMNAFSAFVGSPVIPQALGPDGRKYALALPTVRPLAVQVAACGDLLDPPCSGSASVDTNVADTATVVNPGDWADIQFQALNGSLFGVQLSFNGHLRLDFLSTVDVNSASISGLDVKMTFDTFTGSLNGAGFGPVSDMFRLQINTQGVSTITAGGSSYSGLHGVSVSGSGSYRIAGGTVRVGYWSDANKYVDLVYQNWSVVSGRPAVGSTVSIGAGSGSVSLTVTSSSTSTVVYAATINTGSITRYTVTASYPAAGGAPTYVATVAP